MLRNNSGFHCLDFISYLMLTPFICWSRLHDLAVGATFHAGHNMWQEYVIKLQLCLVCCDIEIGLRYKRMH